MLFPQSSLRTLFLAAKCCELTAIVIDQQTTITDLEERTRRDAKKIADLLRRNQDLTKAIHRTACAGSALPEVVGLLGIAVAAPLLMSWAGPRGLACYSIGFVVGMGWLAFASLREHHRQHTTTPRRREHPAHITEPLTSASIQTRPLGEAYAEESEYEPLPRATEHEDALTARERFFATAKRLGLAPRS